MRILSILFFVVVSWAGLSLEQARERLNNIGLSSFKELATLTPKQYTQLLSDRKSRILLKRYREFQRRYQESPSILPHELRTLYALQKTNLTHLLLLYFYFVSNKRDEYYIDEIASTLKISTKALHDDLYLLEFIFPLSVTIDDLGRVKKG